MSMQAGQTSQPIPRAWLISVLVLIPCQARSCMAAPAQDYDSSMDVA